MEVMHLVLHFGPKRTGKILILTENLSRNSFFFGIVYLGIQNYHGAIVKVEGVLCYK
mgnify:CR=1 FL=1